ncbi:hypothetical protein [Roseobacter weihaiensis]|uniref:hypothetical protein n=1 Tax=Roseobacter weihaiensis TaxID=2763262 RepID=UPI001D0AA8C6|nr:hypothetical protein [Roseobacter sp. H9]
MRRPVKRHRLSRREELQDTRERIEREADPIGFLAAIVRGEPVAVRDYEGRLLSTEHPKMEHRVVAARELARKIAPDMKAIEVDATEGGMTINFISPIPLPNSQPTLAEQEAIEDAYLIEDHEEQET